MVITEEQLNEMADTFCWLQSLTFEQFMEVMATERVDVRFKHKEVVLVAIRRYVMEQNSAEKLSS
jgi:hypothetical protein